MKRITALALLLVVSACSSTSGPTVISTRSVHPASNPSAGIVVLEYTDLQCPSCRKAHANVVAPLLAQDGARIRYEFRHFPLRSMHPLALDAAMAAECASDQGKFWDYVDLAFREQPQMSRERFRTWASEISLDVPRFEECLDSETKREVVLFEYREGKKRGVLGTPTFFVNGRPVQDRLEAIQEAIEAAAK